MTSLTKEYVETIRAGREERQRVVNEILYLTSDLENVIRQYNNHSLTDIVFSELQAFEIGKRVVLTKGVETVLKEVYSNKLIFNCTMRKGSTLGLHQHSDCMEDIVVKSGELLCLTRRQSYEENQVVCYKTGEHHNPVAISDLKMTVIFTKQENETY